jgi:dephospho-CoA kinase
MIVVGLTGGIGSGKSYVAECWSRMGARVLSADTYGHRVLEQDKTVRRALIQRFGKNIVDPSGNLIRAHIAERAFASTAATRALNRIVGPALIRKLYDDIATLRTGRGALLVVDAALLCEWKSPVEFDVRVLVTAPRPLKLKWLSRRGVPYRQAMERMRHQWPDHQKRKWADLEIRNSGSLADLRRKALATYKKIS